MKICIFGAGAIGAHTGACLARAGADVTLVARGPHFEAMKARGVTVIEPDGLDDFTAYPACTQDTEALGVQDVILLTLKGHQIAPALPALRPLIGPRTVVVVAVNGIPWWYFHGLDGPWRDRRVESVDPDGRLWAEIGPERVLGAVIRIGAEVIEPGVVKHTSLQSWYTLGEPDGTSSARLAAVSALFDGSGIEVRTETRIRDEIWNKLLVNLCFNPISALTLGTGNQVAADGAVRAVIERMMDEARALAQALGARVTLDVDQRLNQLAVGPPQNTSMLQDLLAGRPMEIDGIVASVAEMARLTEIPAPTIETVSALIALRARVAGLYPPPAP